MEIGDNLGFIAAYHYDHKDDEESEIEATIATQHDISIDDALVTTIDNKLETPIDSDYAIEIDYFPEGSIESWENDYYQPSFAVHTSTPSKRKMSALEHDEDYKEEATIEYLGLAIEEEGVLRRSHETEGKKSIDGDIKISIDTHQGKGPDARATDSTMIDDIPWILPLLYHGTFWKTLVILESFEVAELHRCTRFLAMDGELPTHPIAEVMPVLLESGTSGSREEAVEEMKEIRLTVRPWCRSMVNPEHGTILFQDRLKPRSQHKIPRYPWTT
ncbi:hypothetical protein DY000_02007760 [Brassica cretica]|uniref:Uncharacterized protein n=1 Tax=Brassica cretica TaxID=69181 RepID=A0ABQ7C089_BRACR|nr:hypothetical protein DY000_02007760 [Brassica cretica]